MEEEKEKVKKFRIKSYGKSELASLYMPKITSKSALEKMHKWIRKSPGLSAALAANGLHPRDKYYTPLQVQLIVNALGEP